MYMVPQVKNLIVVPVSFVSEHIETLEEIDMEYRELAEECGVTKWTRVPAMNTDPGFIADLADLVVSFCILVRFLHRLFLRPLCFCRCLHSA
jgi:protoheme ferro-lyase